MYLKLKYGQKENIQNQSQQLEEDIIDFQTVDIPDPDNEEEEFLVFQTVDIPDPDNEEEDILIVPLQYIGREHPRFSEYQIRQFYNNNQNLRRKVNLIKQQRWSVNNLEILFRNAINESIIQQQRFAIKPFRKRIYRYLQRKKERIINIKDIEYYQLPIDLEIVHKEQMKKYEMKCALIEPSYINVIINDILMKNFYFRLENRDAYKKIMIDNDFDFFAIGRQQIKHMQDQINSKTWQKFKIWFDNQYNQNINILSTQTDLQIDNYVANYQRKYQNFLNHLKKFVGQLFNSSYETLPFIDFVQTLIYTVYYDQCVYQVFDLSQNSINLILSRKFKLEIAQSIFKQTFLDQNLKVIGQNEYNSPKKEKEKEECKYIVVFAQKEQRVPVCQQIHYLYHQFYKFLEVYTLYLKSAVTFDFKKRINISHFYNEKQPHPRILQQPLQKLDPDKGIYLIYKLKYSFRQGENFILNSFRDIQKNIIFPNIIDDSKEKIQEFNLLIQNVFHNQSYEKWDYYPFTQQNIGGQIIINQNDVKIQSQILKNGMEIDHDQPQPEYHFI